MSDNLTTTTTVSTVPSGTVISTDDAGASGHVQRMKLAYSADGVATHAQVDADGVLVNLGTNNDVTLATLPDTAAGDLAAINAALAATLSVNLAGTNGTIDTNNSSSTPLAGDAVFTGSATEITDFASIVVAVYTDVASATDGLSIQYSTDGTNWDFTDVFTIGAGVGKVFTFQPVARYLRVVYTNGAGAQSVFRLQTILRTTAVKPSSHRIQDAITDEDDAELVKSIITGQNPGGTFVNFQATTAGNFKVSLEEVNGAVVPVSNAGLTELAAAINANELDINIASSGATVTVDGSGVTQPVSGTVTETNSAAILADTANMDTNLGTVAGAVSGSEMQVDVVAPLPAGTNAIGKLAANSGVDIGDVDVTSLPPGIVDTNNSTTTPLAGNADYTGTWTDILPYAGVGVTIFADQNSDANGMKFQFSSDGTNADIDIAGGFDYLASTGRLFQFPKQARYFRVVFQNAAAAQSVFRLQTILSYQNVLPTSAHRLDADVVPDRSAELVKAGIIAQINGTGDFTPIQANSAGVLKVGGSVDVDSSALPTGASTAANQTTIIGHVDGLEGLLTTIDADTSSLAGTVAGSEMQVDVVAALPAGDNNIGNVDIASSVALDVSAATVTVDLGANNDVVAACDVAHDTADSGNPVKVGGKAVNMDGTVPGTAVAEGDRTNILTDVYGRQLTTDVHPNFWHVSADYAAAQTNTSIKAAPGAGLKLYITDYMISNGATAGNITLLDGSGGTVLVELYPAINGGAMSNQRTPIPLTANTALVITSTTVTTHSVSISGYIAP